MSRKDNKHLKAKEEFSHPEKSRRETPSRKVYHETLAILDEISMLLVCFPDS
jgi:hypothetical protein